MVLGSAALLLPFPHLGEGDGLLTLTRDADLLIFPCDDEVAGMVHEAIGRGSLFEAHHGYHVDVLRDTVEATLPKGWRARLRTEPVTGAFVLDPIDTCAMKLFAGRDKDLLVVGHVLRAGLVSRDAVREAIAAMPIGERAQFATLRRLGQLHVSG